MSAVTRITNRPEHDEAVAKAEAGQPTVIYVSWPPTPDNKAFAPQYPSLAERHPDVRFYEMELDGNISPMIKFGPWQTPILILMRGQRCKTLLGGNIEKLEEAVSVELERNLN